MGRTNIINITKSYLDKRGYNNINFDNGYGVVVFEKVKIFFYPGNEVLRITAIPTDRKYKIYKDFNIEGTSIGNILLKYQPDKSNSELMYDIYEKYVTDSNIDKVAIFFLNNTQDIFNDVESDELH
ncbi:hypothetical protein H8S10_02225 [Clostridium sp. NSJ-49]|uniref:Uncharacterized protein n=1 Tax=Clostridium disporicum TaxID=84024 RepID=A0A174BNV1_9CLOT|nr:MULTISPECIES: hypothetical protein [Clostridium]MBC5624277.1 hypothetical protein [Clostridium sp. NSJ-49]MCD2500819.1 hypothetical protein [Clostridium sp. NSJ-145]MDU6340222.1 hypothetical protein [Clostridium sp.]CUO02434.1 Uncharacterised protein [Clostridium disporicum]